MTINSPITIEIASTSRSGLRVDWSDDAKPAEMKDAVMMIGELVSRYLSG